MILFLFPIVIVPPYLALIINYLAKLCFGDNCVQCQSWLNHDKRNQVALSGQTSSGPAMFNLIWAVSFLFLFLFFLLLFLIYQIFISDPQYCHCLLFSWPKLKLKHLIDWLRFEGQSCYGPNRKSLSYQLF